MSYDLLTYFERRIEKSKSSQIKAGPFITFSRETGCNGTGIARDLVKELKNHNLYWKFINKEVLEESANKLKVDSSKIKYVFDTTKKSHADEVLAALSSRYYKSDIVVRKTITQVLRHYAIIGNIIMVGRASVATTYDLVGGLHFRFHAPYEWRVNSLKKRKAFESVDAEKFIKQHDKKKQQLIKDFCGKNVSEIQFDMTINCAAFTRPQIIELIIQTMKMKNMI